MSLCTLTTSFLLNQNPSKPQPLVAYSSALFHAAVHSFSMWYIRFVAQDLPWNTFWCVDVVVSETDGLFWSGWLGYWLGFISRGESTPHELFSFIGCCYYCSLSAFTDLPRNPSPHHLGLCPTCRSLPAFLLVKLLLLLCHCRDACVRGTYGWLLQTSVTLATAASPALALTLPPCYATRDTKALSSLTPCSYSLLHHLLHAFILFLISSSFLQFCPDYRCLQKCNNFLRYYW